jgi:hypothetical protein
MWVGAGVGFICGGLIMAGFSPVGIAASSIAATLAATYTGVNATAMISMITAAGV